MVNDFIHDKFNIIAKSIDSGIFVNVEDEIIELKDVSNGLGNALKIAVCAFLNTNGGYIICGIREHENKEYRVTGFDKKKEDELIEFRTKMFKSDNEYFPDLSDYFDFEYHDFRGKHLAIIHVRPVSEDLKYLTYNGKAYERVLSQKKEISKAKILSHDEYKQELEYSKELSIVKDASIDELDIDKIRKYIFRINEKGRKNETDKRDLEEAKPFLIRRNCLKDGQVTLLGLLLFGKEPSIFLENKAEVDCFFGDDSSIGQDKQDFQDDVLNLMTDTFRFIWGHIKVGRSAKDGGRREPEYPEDLIRESINNALAHRDYTINKFITIRVRPNEYLEIKNPGSFKAKMIISDKSDEGEIRRIIPGIPETKNPKLASILKAFDKIESQGIGMATLVGYCLNNAIDVPYYELGITAQTISLIIPSGKLVDEEIDFWFKSFEKYITNKLDSILNEEHIKVLAYFYKSEKLNLKGRYTILLSKSNNHFDVIYALLKAGLIIEHSCSREDASVYILDRELLRTEFSKELQDIFRKINKPKDTLIGIEYRSLDTIQRRVLNIIYRNSCYNQQAVKPSQITPEVYLTEYGKTINPKTYESLGRRVRKICEYYLNIRFLEKDKITKGYKIAINTEGVI
jgi:ATP-dependent DNA helicase RecG